MSKIVQNCKGCAKRRQKFKDLRLGVLKKLSAIGQQLQPQDYVVLNNRATADDKK